VMLLVYCFGVPFLSWCSLRAYREPIKELQSMEFAIAELESEGKFLRRKIAANKADNDMVNN
jgi:hypothetical protein